MSNLLIATILLALAGVVTHQLKQFNQVRVDTGASFNWVSYWTDNLPQALLCIIGTAVVLTITYLTRDGDAITLERLITAYITGIAGNTMAEALGSRTAGGTKI